MRSRRGVRRPAVIAAVILGGLLFAMVVFRSGGYEVSARFQNASQLVKGNNVQVGGVKAGSVTGIKITPDGQAEISFSVDDAFAPLRKGTKVVVRQSSQSGIANRYLDIQIPPGDVKEEIEDGGSVGVDETTTGVDLDQLFNTLDPPTRKGLQGFLQGSAEQYAGVGKEANLGFRYLNPALSTSSRLFNELNRDTPVLERFIVDSAKLVGALAERRDDLADLVANLNATTRAVGSEKVALAEAIEGLPGFMRTTNTTFVNLRAALEDVDPLVDASKPVARKLQPFLADLRLFARDARPTIRDLSRVVRRRGSDNDLTDLTRSFTPLAETALDTRQRNGAARRGAFPESVDALKGSAPIIAFQRPYSPEFVGWLDDFSNRGAYDALGGVSRVQVYINAFTPSPGGGLPTLIPITDRPEAFKAVARTGQFKRCPGSAEAPAEDKSNVLSAEEQKALDCRESDRSVGP